MGGPYDEAIRNMAHMFIQLSGGGPVTPLYQEPEPVDEEYIEDIPFTLISEERIVENS